MMRFLLTWFVVALVIGATGVLRLLPVPLPALPLTLTIAILIALAASRALRDRALSCGVRPLIAVHLTRFVGFYFLALADRGVLPREFAIPAGWGDIAVATAALAVLLLVPMTAAWGRTVVAIWNVAGLLDILFVLATGVRMMRVEPALQATFAVLPLSLLPVMIVPLVIVTHVLILVWLWRRS